MKQKLKQLVRNGGLNIALGLALCLGMSAGATALGSQQNPQSGSTGLQGTISSPPPSQAPTIVVPVTGRTFTSTPITVSGLCTSGLLVKVFSNNIFVGSVQCVNGSFSLQIDLLSGQNDLIARVYDSLDQASPDSNKVTVTFQDGQFAAFGQRVSLTSNYAKLGANPGAELTWPLILSGGSGPYAISADWGDGTATSLKSLAFPGEFSMNHVYKSAGVYRVIFKATDINGQVAFLQVVGVANGKAAQGTTGSGSASGTSGGVCQILHEFVWWPFLIIFPLIILTFWLGKRYELQSIHRQLEQQADYYDKDSNR